MGPINEGHKFISPLGSFVQCTGGSSPRQEDTAEGTEASLDCFQTDVMLERNTNLILLYQQN